jgi:hypothetical protein
MARTRNCTNHCRGCDRHFASLGAFDAHRIGTPSTRECESPVIITEAGGPHFDADLGGCKISDPEHPESNIEIWYLADSRERARERFGVPGPSEAVEGSQAVTPERI